MNHKQSLTVLNIGHNYRITGGSDRYMFSMSSLLESKGHHVIPFAAKHALNLPTPWDQYFPESLDFEKPSIGKIHQFFYSAEAARQLERLIDAIKPDIAHLHIYYGKITSSILSVLKEKGVPIVQTLHEYKPICPVYTLMRHGQPCEACGVGNYWRAAVHKCNRGSLVRSTLSTMESYVSHWLGANSKIDHFITVSEFQRQIFIRNGLPAARITTVHNFIDASQIEPFESQGNYMLFFGRLESVKGIFILLDAATRLAHIPFKFVGEGNDAQALKDEINKRGLQNVEVLPFQDKEGVKRLVEGALCSITPSIWPETFGLTLIETFAMGRPVIASNIGGMTEIVEDGVSGFLVPPNDVNALASKIQWMWEHRTEAYQMGKEGRRRTEALFSPDSHYHKLLSIYEKVL